MSRKEAPLDRGNRKMGISGLGLGKMKRKEAALL
jgi:hypothetical protein